MSRFLALSPAEMIQSPWILGPAAFVLWIALGTIVVRFTLKALQRVTARTRWSWDDVLAQALGAPLRIAVLATGLLVLGRILPLSPEWDRAFDVVLAAAIVLALVLFADRLARGLLDRLTPLSAVLQGARGLILGGLRGLIIALGLLVFLDSIGISITPILASLGVGSLAVALALQETLANLFAGVYMVVDKPIEPGHYVRLETGEEGLVTKVGWRSTWIRMLTNNVLVVPNSKLAGSSIVNYNLPDSEVVVVVPVGVHYASDLERVERVTLWVAREVMETTEGGAAGAEPLVRFASFGDSAIVYNAILRAASFDRARVVQHAFIKRLTDRFRSEGIVIPYPIRTLDVPTEAAAALRGAVAPPAGRA
jgi:small-conductance mechanosensitive channel